MIETERLILRDWQDRDRAAYHAIKSDPLVMATLGPLQSREESDATLDRLIGFGERNGYTFWAMERRRDAVLLGYCGLVHPPEGTPVEGELEIGWGLSSEHWRQGYAREAAMATLEWAWANTNRQCVAAITSEGNAASWGLMERLGMTRYPNEDFDHPGVPDGSPLKPHVVYRIARPATSRRAMP